MCVGDSETPALCRTNFTTPAKSATSPARQQQRHSISTSYTSPSAFANTMSQPVSEDSEDPLSPGKQYIPPGEQSSGDVVGGGSGGNGDGIGSGSSKQDSGPEEGSRQAALVAFRASLRARGLQNDSQYDSPVFYDTTPDEELSPASGGTEGYEASLEDGAGRYDDSDEVSEDDGAQHEDGGNEASEDELPYRGDDYPHDGKDFPSPLGYASWSNDPPSGSDNDGNDTNFNARLIVALQSEADYATLTRHVEIADSQASSDDLDNTVNHTASSIKVEVADSQADSDEPENPANYAALLIKVEEADSQPGSDDIDSTANYAALLIKEELADSDELEITRNYAAPASEEEMADYQAGSDDLDNTANHATFSGDVEAADSQADSDDNANGAASPSDKEIPDSQADSNDPVVHSDTSDSEAVAIVARHYAARLQNNARGRLAPVRTPPTYRKKHNPDSDPDSLDDHNSDSSLSELENTPEPVDPELLRLEREYKRRALKLCTCLGWCTCSRYGTFYGTKNANEADGPLVLPSQTHLSETALSNERFPTSAMRSTIAAEERYEERVVEAFSWDRKRKPALAPVSWEGEEWSEFPGTHYKPAFVEEVSDAGD
jgi:hypothetical protein